MTDGHKSMSIIWWKFMIKSAIWIYNGKENVTPPRLFVTIAIIAKPFSFSLCFLTFLQGTAVIFYKSNPCKTHLQVSTGYSDLGWAAGWDALTTDVIFFIARKWGLTDRQNQIIVWHMWWCWCEEEGRCCEKEKYVGFLCPLLSTFQLFYGLR